jgi:hypothetical protein
MQCCGICAAQEVAEEADHNNATIDSLKV